MRVDPHQAEILDGKHFGRFACEADIHRNKQGGCKNINICRSDSDGIQEPVVVIVLQKMERNVVSRQRGEIDKENRQ